LDNFLARHMAGPQGRFLSPDPFNAGADPTNPQSWNMYSYVRNNPLRYIDPTGMSCVTLDDGSQGDDGDGQGCEPAGVSPGNPNNPNTITPYQVNVNSTPPDDLSLWDLPGQWFVGFGDLVFNNDLGGLGRMIYAVGAQLTGGAILDKAVGCARTGLALRNAAYAQKTASTAFSAGGKFAGQTVQDVSQALTIGQLSTADVPVQYAVNNGTTYVLNTRSAAALTLAGKSTAFWNATDVTADLGANLRLAGQLGRNPGAPFSSVNVGGCSVGLGK
jgi:hypothetical protein